MAHDSSQARLREKWVPLAAHEMDMAYLLDDISYCTFNAEHSRHTSWGGTPVLGSFMSAAPDIVNIPGVIE